MQFGRVRGSVVATVKAEGLEGVRLLLVEALDDDLAPTGAAVVAADAIHTAGPGDIVQVIASREAAEALSPSFVPVDHAIVALVDQVDGRRVL